jgi:hypothetical protein
MWKASFFALLNASPQFGHYDSVFKSLWIQGFLEDSGYAIGSIGGGLVFSVLVLKEWNLE